jgi:hypothetical protein
MTQIEKHHDADERAMTQIEIAMKQEHRCHCAFSSICVIAPFSSICVIALFKT